MAKKKPAAKPAPKKKQSAASASAAKASLKSPGRPSEKKSLKALTPEFVTKTPPDLAAREAAARQLEEEQGKHLAVIDEQFGDNLPYDPLRLESEVRFYMQQSAEAMLEAGKRLVVLKEREEPGNFLKSLDRIGIAPRGAQKMMQAAVKFSGSKAALLPRLTKTKMFDLLSEDDAELEALAAGGTLRGLTLDEIDILSPSELRKALRETRGKVKEGAEISEKLLASKDDKINKLERELNERTHRVATWEGAYKEIGGNILTMSGYVIQGLNGLRVQIDEILKEAGNMPEVTDDEIAAIALPLHQQLLSLNDLLADTRAHFEFNLVGYLPQLNGTMLLQMKMEKEAAAAKDAGYP